MNKQILILLTTLFVTNSVFSQTDSLRLVCPFENGTGREPKEAFTWDPPEKKIIMITKKDTVMRSCIDAKVSNVNPTEDGRYEVVIYYKDFYFWYYGITKPYVKRGDVLKAGQALGFYQPGTEIEFRMFKKEEPMDPRRMLDCRTPNDE